MTLTEGAVPNSNEFRPGLYRHFKGGLYFFARSFASASRP